ncbi:MAG: glutathione S-transferase family protein [Candidatus Sphingomonas colombiensis]|nr:glutathione S-transferase family protein [Sphingomonas sp.]WEK44167.1 MAG: glutathione S-transferase family protein [Sphingomonas sp.]
MHIYGSLASPFVQRVLMAARAKGHEIAVVSPPGAGMQSSEFRAISPMGRVPVLELDSGEHLCESAALIGYLDDTLDGPALLPADPLARARVRELEALAIGEIAVGLRPIMAHVVFHRSDAPEVVAAAHATIALGLDALDRLIPDGPAVAPTLADCALVPVLGLARLIDPVANTWPAITRRERVANYFARALLHPIARRSIDEMEAGFAAIRARAAG